MRKFILSIFLLYFASSILCLIFFMKTLYDSNLKLIIQKNSFELSSILKELNFLVKTQNSILNYDFTQNGDILFFIKDLNSGEILKKDFVLDDKKDLKQINKHIFVLNKEFYLADNIHAKKRVSNYNVILKNKIYKKEINLLFIKISIIFIFSFIFLSFVGYFIIRLSLRPLFDKISSLNSFIESATHEINTPLSVILMSIEMFDKNPKKYLLNIKKASNNLSSLNDKLINLTLKNLPNNLEFVNLKDFLEEKMSYFSPMMSERNLSFDLNLNSVTLKTDIKKLDVIFDNLISNAIKYSNENSKISLFLDKNKFEISNLGEKIEAKNLNDIFKKYARFSKAQAGFGIGLSLVKKYSDELNYKILCKADGNKTKFILEF
ncbi:two-component system sensor histidine kinase [Campylobacter ureolyticus RIGS 9880]|uniref:histidine kinase n=1 Tax=Campylobacter ureolyticus RIGS 9880 TaxID=1032069 RepID=A0AAU8UCQ3_9BACT|nr:HAMP domain-containing sensor histidine kinase [Campylobacter ureolyticus]AKT90874.1 two-component system sensor histidine kinase [Campylobacter ureolyticus RIGS 9880]